ncbi:MAG: putative pilO [Parcubacteria bacterium C7867-005]|nr:MAG: putative pilO [Parcubacteria bacterium C7867-005]
MKSTTSLTLLLISIGIFYTFIDPKYKEVKILRSNAEQFESILSNVEELKEKRSDLLIKYQSIPRVEVDRLAKMLPDNIDTVRLAIDFDSIAAQYGISIKGIQADSSGVDNSAAIIQTGSGAPYEEVSVSFRFVASYDNFRKFMEDIEQSLRVIDVKSVTFQATDNGLYEYSVAIQTYWLR